MISAKTNFKVHFKTQNSYINHIIGPDKKYYLCVEHKQTFQIQLKSIFQHDVVYGAKLFIDGKEVVFLKTFKGHGHFFGIKLGNGHYREFVFEEPISYSEKNINSEISGNSLSSSIIKKDNKDFGTVLIKFFSTRPVKSKKKIKMMKRKIDFNPSTREDDKKFYLRSTTVNEGEHFQVPNTYKDFLDRIQGDTIIENIVDFSNKIDEITINYVDFLALQLMGVISLKNYEHLKYIPHEISPRVCYAVAAIQTIINAESKKMVLLDNIELLFRTVVGHDLRIYYSHDDNCDKFIKEKPLYFRVNQDRYVSIANSHAYDSCMIPWKLQDEGKYVTTQNEQKLIKSNNNSKIESKIIEYINLIDDEEEGEGEDVVI